MTAQALAPVVVGGAWWSPTAWREWAVPPKCRRATLGAFLALGGAADVVARLDGWAAAGDARWLYLHGPPGTGKTSLAVALGAVLVTRGRTAAFQHVQPLLDRARALTASKGSQVEDLFAGLAAVDLLVVDDLGRERQTDWTADQLGLLLARRYDHERQTVITSNLDLAALAQRVGGQTSWRIAELSDVVHVPGPNLRAVLARRPAETLAGAVR